MYKKRERNSPSFAAGGFTGSRFAWDPLRDIYRTPFLGNERYIKGDVH